MVVWGLRGSCSCGVSHNKNAPGRGVGWGTANQQQSRVQAAQVRPGKGTGLASCSSCHRVASKRPQELNGCLVLLIWLQAAAVAKTAEDRRGQAQQQLRWQR